MIYFISNGSDLVKIGYSSNPLRRLKDLQTASPNQLELLAVLPGDKTTEIEYHSKFATFKIRGEWFKMNSKLQSEIKAIKSIYGLIPTKENLELYDEAFIAWERETAKVDEKYDSLTSEIENQIEELEKKIDCLNNERDEELSRVEQKFPFPYPPNGYEVAK